MPNKNSEWWNGGWQRRGNGSWDGDKESSFRRNDNVSVTLIKKSEGFWVDGEPSRSNGDCRIHLPPITERKSTIASKPGCNKKDNPSTSLPSIGKGACAEEVFTGKNSFGLYNRKVDGWYTQTPRPKFMASNKDIPELDISKVLAIVHGIKIQFSHIPLQDGLLRSAYSRLGPYPEKYIRAADLNGGGALAVYTRAVGTVGSKKWKALGMGVGSGTGTIQFVMKPDILVDPNHIWRASGTDNMGMPPGAKKSDGLNSFDRWQQQSERGRNETFMSSVVKTMTENNEQMHWECLPLTDLKALILRKGELAPRELQTAAMNRGVPILRADPMESLFEVLFDNGMIDSYANWV